MSSYKERKASKSTVLTIAIVITVLYIALLAVVIQRVANDWYSLNLSWWQTFVSIVLLRMTSVNMVK